MNYNHLSTNGEYMQLPMIYPVHFKSAWAYCVSEKFYEF